MLQDATIVQNNRAEDVMSQIESRVVCEMRLPELRFELVTQESCGPFARTHHLAVPCITYLPPTAREPARVCFGTPDSHRDLEAVGIAVIALGNVPLHLVSPGFSRRDILVCHFEPSAFKALSGFGIDPSAAMLDACRDVRAAAVIKTLDRILSELEGSAVGRETVLKGLALVLMGELARYFAGIDESAQANGMLAPWQMRKIDARISDTGHKRPDLAELAAICGVGKRHLMRGFKATYGMTVLEYIERATFARAIQLLQTTDMPLKQLSEMLGYASQSSFSAAFGRHFGDTPHCYRARRRAGVQADHGFAQLTRDGVSIASGHGRQAAA